MQLTYAAWRDTEGALNVMREGCATWEEINHSDIEGTIQRRETEVEMRGKTMRWFRRNMMMKWWILRSCFEYKGWILGQDERSWICTGVGLIFRYARTCQAKTR